MKENGKAIIFAGGYGLFAGLIMTLLFKWTETVTGEKVYTLLLNIDYIPVVSDFVFPEWVEVSFHLVVSVAVAFGFYMLYRLRPLWNSRAVVICTGVSVVIGVALFPTTVLSERTPEITNGLSLFYWLGGHALFGMIVGFLFRFEKGSILDTTT